MTAGMTRRLSWRVSERVVVNDSTKFMMECYSPGWFVSLVSKKKRLGVCRCCNARRKLVDLRDVYTQYSSKNERELELEVHVDGLPSRSLLFRSSDIEGIPNHRKKERQLIIIYLEPSQKEPNLENKTPETSHVQPLMSLL